MGIPNFDLNNINIRIEDVLKYLQGRNPGSIAVLEGGFIAEALKAIFKLEDVLIDRTGQFANISRVYKTQTGEYVEDEADVQLPFVAPFFRDYEAEHPGLTVSQAIQWILRNEVLLNQQM